MSNLQTYYHFKLDFVKQDQHTWVSGYSPVEYPSRECKHDTKESKGNMFNPIFKENVQGQKHPGSCVFAEPELLM